MHVFVTGAATELGREVIRQLVDRGHHVTGMIRRRSESAAIRRDGSLSLVADPASAVEIERAIAYCRSRCFSESFAPEVEYPIARWPCLARFGQNIAAANGRTAASGQCLRNSVSASLELCIHI